MKARAQFTIAFLLFVIIAIVLPPSYARAQGSTVHLPIVSHDAGSIAPPPSPVIPPSYAGSWPKDFSTEAQWQYCAKNPADGAQCRTMSAIMGDLWEMHKDFTLDSEGIVLDAFTIGVDSAGIQYVRSDNCGLNRVPASLTREDAQFLELRQILQQPDHSHGCRAVVVMYDLVHMA